MPLAPAVFQKKAEALTALIAYAPTVSLHANRRNARKHSRKQVNKVAASIKEFGFINPVVVDENGTVLVGHCRLEAAALLALETVPTIRLDHLTDEQKRAYMLADNRLAEDAVWDLEKLAVELKDLSDLKLDFTIESTGFETVEIDRIIEKDDIDRASAREVLPEPDPPSNRRPLAPATCGGWGSTFFFCADATLEENYARLMGDDRAQMVVTDLPYNLSIGSIVGSGAIQHGEFPMASGEMTGAEFTAFLRGVFQQLVRFSVDGSIHFLFMDWRHDLELRHAAEGVYSEYKNLCVWNKANAGLGTFYRSKHELIFVFKTGTAPHINNFGLGGDGRYRTNVWDYPGVNKQLEDAVFLTGEVKGMTFDLDAAAVDIDDQLAGADHRLRCRVDFDEQLRCRIIIDEKLRYRLIFRWQDAHVFTRGYGEQYGFYSAFSPETLRYMLHAVDGAA